MNHLKYNFYLKTNKAFFPVFKRELKHILSTNYNNSIDIDNIDNDHTTDNNSDTPNTHNKSLVPEYSFDQSKEFKQQYLKIKSEIPPILRILQQSRLIDSIKVEICRNKIAESEKTLKMSTKNIEWETFLPFENAVNYHLPKISVHSFKSKLYHNGLIGNIIKSHLNRRAYIFDKTFESRNKVSSKGDKGDKISSKGDKEYKSLNTDNKNSSNSNYTTNNSNINSNLNINSLMQFPKLTLYLDNDRMTIFKDLTNISLTNHGYKKVTAKDSLQEDIAATIVNVSGIDYLANNTNNSNKATIWDPFCGCGTILIEAYLKLFNIPARKLYNFKSILDNKYINNCEEEFNRLLKEGEINSIKNKMNLSSNSNNIHFIGSDISSHSMKAVQTNTAHANILNRDNQYSKIIGLGVENNSSNSVEVAKEDNSNDNNNFLNIDNPLIYKETINPNMNIFLGDFEKIYNGIIKKSQCGEITWISHLPYLKNNENTTKSLYIRIGKFIKTNFDHFQNVFFLVSKRDGKDGLEFKRNSGLKWDIMLSFLNNGNEVEFLRLKK